MLLIFWFLWKQKITNTYMEKNVIIQTDILKEYDNVLEQYDIKTLKLEDDPDLKLLETIMKKIKEEDN